MGKLAKLCAVFIPIGLAASIAGSIIIAVSEEPGASEVIDVGTGEEIFTTYEEDDSLIVYSSNEADSIVLYCKAADINLYKTENYAIDTFELDQSFLSVTNTDGALNVKYDKEFIADIENDVLTIGIPRSCKSITIQCNAGDISIDEFMGSTMDISIDSGSINIGNSTVSESCRISNTLGNVYFYDSNITALNTDMVSGYLNIYDTMLSGSSNLNIDVGNANLTLKGFPSDYTINTNVKVGEIDCDYELNTNSYSTDQVNISILAGDCSIDFYE